MIKAAKPTGKPFKLSDTGRLYLLVSATGAKHWKWNYRLDNKDCTYSLGQYPAVSLAEAREARDAARKLVAQGIHPLQYKKEQQYKSKLDTAATFWSVCEEWIAQKKIKWTERYAKQVERVLGRYIRDTQIGTRPIRSISTPEIFALIESVAKRTVLGQGERRLNAPKSAILLKQWCDAVFRRAIVSGKADSNPVAALKTSDVIQRPKVKNNHALTVKELRDFLPALVSFQGQRHIGIAIELMMLTFVRTIELRKAQWQEFDLAGLTWTIPAERMKVKTAGDHIVPLSTQAVALLKELRDINGQPLDSAHSWLFPNRRRADACISETTINRALERMGFNGKGTIGFSAHGFRGTASTMLHEMNYRSEVIEAQLAHRERNAVKAAYNKAKYLDDRRVMMQQWADYIDSLRNSDNVVPLKQQKQAH